MPHQAPLSALCADERGGVLIEYLILVPVALLIFAALMGVGPKTVENYAAQRAALYQSNP